MKEDEILTNISFRSPPTGTRSTFIKLALRRAQAISVINVAACLTLKGAKVQKVAIALGSVAPTIVRAREAEEYLLDQTLDPGVISRAAELALSAASPIDDLRGTAEYRKEMIRVCTQRALTNLALGTEGEGYPHGPVMLWGKEDWQWEKLLAETYLHSSGTEIETTINGKRYTFSSGQGKSLLRLLREEAGLIGTKEGCSEGECGACTIFLDGMAVMSCLVPAPRAHGASIVTIEGLSSNGELHPIQQAFIEEGAVQCGYCTPGFLMSGAKLLEERSRPTRWDIEQSITGNLCRCTGYYKIIKAFERAAVLNEDG
jgi:carbon-monoxide dehydrogenase medium subunit